MCLTERFYKLVNSEDPNELLLIKGNAFLEIPLFKIIFDRYSKTGLPPKTKLVETLEGDYKISSRYSSQVANSIIDSISKYFKRYGETIPSQEGEAGMGGKVNNIKNLDKKIEIVNIRINSPIGNFNLEATNREEFEKVMKIISVLWDKKGDTDKNQEEGAHET